MSNPKAYPLAIAGIRDFTATATPQAIAEKNQLLESGSFILTVQDDDEQADAVEIAALIKTVERDVENCRKEIKRPILDAGIEVDTAAKKYLKELTVERVRIELLLTHYVVQKREEFELAQELQRAEAEESRKEQQRLIDEQNERQRKLEEAARLANLPPPPPPEPLPVAVQVFQGPAERPPGVEGAAFREEWDFEVTDIHSVYAFNRFFVKLEVDRSNLKAWLNLPGNDPSKVPGIRAFKTQKVQTRAVKGRGNGPALETVPGLE